MNLGSVYNSVNFLLNKDISGYSFTPDQFSLVCQMVQIGIYNDAIKAKIRPFANQKADVDPNEYTVLGRLIKTVSLTDPFTCPIDFMYEDSVRINGLNAEILDSKRYNELVSNPFFEPKQPPVKVEQNKIVTNIVPVSCELNYYRKPVDPYFDYCINANGVVIYMEPGSWIVKLTGSLVRATTNWATSTTYSKGDRLVYNGIAYVVLNDITSSSNPANNPDYQSIGNAVISLLVTHLSNPSTDYYSQSVELDVPDYFYTEFINAVVQWAIQNLSNGVKQ